MEKVTLNPLLSLKKKKKQKLHSKLNKVTPVAFLRLIKSSIPLQEIKNGEEMLSVVMATDLFDFARVAFDCSDLEIEQKLSELMEQKLVKLQSSSGIKAPDATIIIMVFSLKTF